nr:thermonuclease family protein [uncultured Sandarakinorhabdus sp.]
MPLPMIFLAAAAASFVCENPSHHDGDNVRCANVPGSMRLQGIDAPEMPGACRPGRSCVDGDPFAARDYLRSLTEGKTLQCVQEDTDNYGRRIVNCNAGTMNISCAMIESGHAVPRYAPLDCSGPSAAPEIAPDVMVESTAEPKSRPEPEPPPVIVPANLPARPGTSGLDIGMVPFVLLGLLLINLIT